MLADPICPPFLDGVPVDLVVCGAEGLCCFVLVPAYDSRLRLVCAPVNPKRRESPKFFWIMALTCDVLGKDLGITGLRARAHPRVGVARPVRGGPGLPLWIMRTREYHANVAIGTKLRTLLQTCRKVDRTP